MKICILGAGNVGSALADNLADHGYSPWFGVRHPDRFRGPRHRAVALGGAARSADMVIIAVPFAAAADALAASDPTPDAIVVDATNPLRAPVPAGFRSGAEWIASSCPGIRLVKAFNVVGAEIMRDPDFGEHRALMPVAGDDREARRATASLAGELGFEAVEAGALSSAGILECAAAYWVLLAFQAGMGRDFAFGALRPRESG